MRLKILLFPLMALLLALNSPAPRPKIASALRLRATCPLASGNCRVILSWTRPANYSATLDSAHVTWNQLTPGAVFIDSGATKATADTVTILRPADGKTKTGTVKLCYTRIGWSGDVCNGTLAWAVDAPLVAPDTGTGLKITGLIVKPDSLTITTAEWTALGAYYSDNLSGTPANAPMILPWSGFTDTFPTGTDTSKLRPRLRAADRFTTLAWTCPEGGPAHCPSRQICSFVVRSDGAVGMTENSAPIAECQARYDSIPGHLPTYTPIQFRLAPGERPPIFKVAFTRGVLTEVALNNRRLRRGENGDWILPRDLTIALR